MPITNPKTAQTGFEVALPFLLPHELLPQLLTKDIELLQKATAVTGTSVEELHRKWCSDFDLSPHMVVPVGFFGDGVPHQKNKSVNCYSWNMPALGPSSTRYLMTCLPKEFQCSCGCRGRHTADAIMGVFLWSMCVLHTGHYPQQRHDGSEWQATDKARSKFEGPLGLYGALLQCRGDWQWYNQVFGFPSWSGSQICWRCLADSTSHPWRDAGPAASWRSTSHGSAAFFARQRASGVRPSPLFSCPGFSLEAVFIDILHCMDLGVAQDILGNVFWEAVETLVEGGNRGLRMKAFWCKLKDHYKLAKPPCQLQGLTEEMLRKDGKSPKLKAKGAETRHLVPFALEVATEMHQKSQSVHSKTVVRCTVSLVELYLHMGMEPYRPQAAADACMAMCQLYGALAREAANAGRLAWVQKPKMHLAQELFEKQAFVLGNPSGFWNYKDEDFMGWISDLAHSRGGGARRVQQQLHCKCCRGTGFGWNLVSDACLGLLSVSGSKRAAHGSIMPDTTHVPIARLDRSLVFLFPPKP